MSECFSVDGAKAVKGQLEDGEGRWPSLPQQEQILSPKWAPQGQKCPSWVHKSMFGISSCSAIALLVHRTHTKWGPNDYFHHLRLSEWIVWYIKSHKIVKIANFNFLKSTLTHLNSLFCLTNRQMWFKHKRNPSEQFKQRFYSQWTKTINQLIHQLTDKFSTKSPNPLFPMYTLTKQVINLKM